MKLGVAVVLLATIGTAAPAAADERTMFVSVGGTVGIGGAADDENQWGGEPDAEGVLIGRVFATWDLPKLPYKEPRGYHWRGGVAPEVVIGRIRVADHRTGDPDDNAANFVAIGGRVEAALSQRRMGLLEISARGAFYAAGRVGLLDDENRTPMLEAVVGEYIYAGDTVRFGAEVGVLGIFGEEEQYYAIREGVSARGPWADNTGDYFAVVTTLYLGFPL